MRTPPATLGPPPSLYGAGLLSKHYPNPVCSCGAGIHARVHAKGCDPEFFLSANVDTKPAKPAGLILPPGVTPRKRKPTKRGQTRPWPKSYMFLLQFSFTRPVNIDLWKLIKAPPGWRKNPTTKDKQYKYRGVRFQCTDLKYALTPDEIEVLRAKLYMILEEVF